MEKFKVFTRTWWKHNPSWPNGREPQLGKKNTRRRNLTEEEARAFCEHWNATHKPGPLSLKAEYEEQ